jgi:hypothetical protein
MQTLKVGEAKEIKAFGPRRNLWITAKRARLGESLTKILDCAKL